MIIKDYLGFFPIDFQSFYVGGAVGLSPYENIAAIS